MNGKTGVLADRMSEQTFSTLADAVARTSAFVLSLPSAGMFRHHRSRFLAMSEEALWVESVPSEHSLLDELIRTAHPATLVYKSGKATLSFCATVLARDVDYQINSNGDIKVEALRLEIPAEFKAIQRRRHHRVPTPEDELSIRMWRIGATADLRQTPASTQEVQTRLRDLSLGGVGVICSGTGGQPPKVTNGERVRVELKSEYITLVLAGEMRCSDNPGENREFQCGVKWTQLQHTLEGRRALAQLTGLVGDFERRELRRKHRSSAA